MAWMLVRIFLRKKQSSRLRQQQGLKLKRWARAVTYVFNVHTLVLLAVSCLSVYVCASLNWRWNMDYSMVSTGTIFPLTYTLGQAFTRRERATILIANMKATVVALYYMHRDWDQSYGYPDSLGNDGIESARRAKTLLLDLCISIRRYITSPQRWESLAEARLTASRREFLSLFEHNIHLTEKDRLFHKTVRKLVEEDEGRKHLTECYRIFSRLSVLNEKLTLTSGYTRGGEGGLSRTNQYLRYLIANLEELRSIKEYRTPTMMRHACGVLLHIFAVILAPYFVHFCDHWEEEDHDGQMCVAGYMSAISFVLIVMLLYHVQQDLENCMDETGLDDVFLTIAEELDDLGGERVLQSVHSSFSDFHVIRAATASNHTINPRDTSAFLGATGIGRRSSQDITRLKTLSTSREMDPLYGPGMISSPGLGMRGGSYDLDTYRTSSGSLGIGMGSHSPPLRTVPEETSSAIMQGEEFDRFRVGSIRGMADIEVGTNVQSSPGSDTPLRPDNSATQSPTVPD